jgi:hypothetical protein
VKGASIFCTAFIQGLLSRPPNIAMQAKRHLWINRQMQETIGRPVDFSGIVA